MMGDRAMFFRKVLWHFWRKSCNWSRDSYYQYFTGERYFQHQVPHKRSGRSRLGADCLDHLLKESLRVVHASGALGEKDMEAVSVDSTVQEKALRFPTDAQLLYTAIVRLGMQARGAGVKLRQSYVRIGRRALIMVGRYGHARQFKRRNRHIRFFGSDHLRNHLHMAAHQWKTEIGNIKRYYEPLLVNRLLDNSSLT